MQDNVLAQQGIVSKLSDDQLVKEVKTPSGSAPTYLVMAEMQKRDSIRNAMGGAAPKGTVRDQMLQGVEMRQPEMPLPQIDPAAIAGMMQARGMAPQGMPPMPQGMPPMPQGMPPMPQGMPQGAPQMGGMPQMPQMPEMPQGAPPAAGIAGAAQMAGPQGFANGGAIPVVAPYGSPSNPNLHLVGVESNPTNPKFVPTNNGENIIANLFASNDRMYADPGKGRLWAQKGHAESQPMTRPGLNIPQGFADGGAIPRYADGTPGGLPALLGGTADRYGSYSPQELAANTELLSSFYNKDNLRPEDLGTYQSNILNQFGGIEAFTKPFAAPIDTAQRQLSGMMNPTSQALIQAGAAMMNAPNGSLLSGIGVGLGAGLSGYQKAQLEQRGLQDRMADLQLKQSQAGLQGRMQSMEIGSRERQGDFSQYNTGRTLAENRAAGILGVNQANATGARSSADAALGRQTTMAAAQLQEAGATSRAFAGYQAAIPAQATEVYAKAYDNDMQRAGQMASRLFPVAPGFEASAATQLAIDKFMSDAHLKARANAKRLAGGYVRSALERAGINSIIPDGKGGSKDNSTYSGIVNALTFDK